MSVLKLQKLQPRTKPSTAEVVSVTSSYSSCCRHAGGGGGNG